MAANELEYLSTIMSGIYSYIFNFFFGKNELSTKNKDEVDSSTQSDAQPIPNLSQPPMQSTASQSTARSNEQSNSKSSNASSGIFKISLKGSKINNMQVGDHNTMCITSVSNKKDPGPKSGLSCNVQNPNNMTIKKSKWRDPESYKMSSKPRGYMLIINNSTFYKEEKDRKGSFEDVSNLSTLFQNHLQFQVGIKTDLTAQQMANEMISFADSEKHKETDSCILCVMSHGNKDGILSIDNRSINIDQILPLFKNKEHLTGKPKLFLFQACRGNEMNISAQPDSPVTDSTFIPPKPKEKNKYEYLQLGDYLIGNATIPGYQALRNPQTGSWFISAICDEIINHAYNTDMLSLTTKVNHNVTSIQRGGKMQQPEWHNSLNKKWYLYPE